MGQLNRHPMSQLTTRDFPAQAIVLDLLDKLEALREHQNLLAWKLSHLLANGDAGSGYEGHGRLCASDVAALNRAWDEFIAQGGVDADDLRRFLRGKIIGASKVVTRRHLRVVRSSNARRSVENVQRA